jgi:hypothetical protein
MKAESSESRREVEIIDPKVKEAHPSFRFEAVFG